MKMLTERKIKKYLLFLRENEKSDATIAKYKCDLKKFSDYLNGRIINKKQVCDYKNFLGEKYPPTSANSMIAAVNGFFRYIGHKEFCVKQFKVQKKACCTEKEEISKREYSRLVLAAERKGNKRLSMIIQTLCGTGMRISELRFLTVENVQKGIVKVSCKNKTRDVFIVSELRKKLLRYISEQKIVSGEIFITRNEKSVDRSNVWREMKALCEWASVDKEKVFPHNFRHLFARAFYSVEKDIAKLADVLGHSNINTTRLYIITTFREHCRIIEKMRLIL